MANKAINTTKQGAFNTGRGFMAAGDNKSAGGANLKKPKPTVQGTGDFNKARLVGATEVFHNGRGPKRIS